MLAKLIENYNSTIHTTINSIPKDVYSRKQLFTNQKLSKIVSNAHKVKKYNVGDTVRIINKRTIFGKIGETYSRSTYKIVQRSQNSYIVQNTQTGTVLKRTIKPNEIQVIELCRLPLQRSDIFEGEMKRQKIIRRLRKEGLINPRSENQDTHISLQI